MITPRCAADSRCEDDVILKVVWQRGPQKDHVISFCQKHYDENLRLRPDIMSEPTSIKSIEELKAEFWKELNS